LLVGYIDPAVADRDLGGSVDERRPVAARVNVPSGYHVARSGAYESMQCAQKRPAYVIPVTLAIIIVPLLLKPRSLDTAPDESYALEQCLRSLYVSLQPVCSQQC
jgi:Cu/Ag efflux pump CusA